MNDNDPMPRTDAELAVIHRQTAVATSLLLGRGRMEPGVVISSGDRLGAETRIGLAQAASSSDTDLIHLEFGYDADRTYRLIGIVLILPRDGEVHVQSACQLYVGKPGAPALILPTRHGRGAFRLKKNELVHQPTKPADAAAGIDRAARLLADAFLEVEGAVDARFHLLDVASQ